MYRTPPSQGPIRFYRVEICYNLFGYISVAREWGVKGRGGQSRIRLFGNLREASLAADIWRNKALRRGYVRCEVSVQ